MHLKDPTLLRTQAFIQGEWVNAANHATHEVHNPATREKLGTVPDMGAAETQRAIKAAHAAFPAWAAKTAKERGTILRKWFDLMMANQDDLATIMTAEQGKPLAESKGEIAYAASFIDWFAEEGKRLYGDVIPTHQSDKRLLVLRQPIGVVAAITPWNFPAAMITRKAGPALAAGCTFVCKPAHQTPYSALAMAELGRRAGIPAGVLNIVTGMDARRHRRRNDFQPDRAQDHLHRLDRRRQEAHGAVGRHAEETVARAGRQCAVHCVRGCRSGCRGRGRDHQQVPQYGANLCLCQPVPGTELGV